MTTIIVANPSDPHCGGSVGLCPPDIPILQDSNGGRIHELFPHQQYLWFEKWLPDWRFVYQLKRQLNALLVTVVGGDVTENMHHNNVQVVSPKPEDHVRIAYEALCIPASISDRLIINRGTPSHSGAGAGLEELVAEMLRLKFPKLPITMSYIWEPTLAGVKFNFAHHGAFPGSRKWLEGNVLRYNMRDVMLRYIVRGERPPQVMARSHYHRALHETVRVKRRGGQNYVAEALLNPAYCGVSEFAYKVKVEKELVLADNGMYLYVVNNGRFTILNNLVVGHDVVDREVWP